MANTAGQSDEGLVLDELVEAIRGGRLVVFAGAGVSRDSGLPTASQIIARSLESILVFSHCSDEIKATAREAIVRELRLEVFLRALVELIGEKALLPLSLLEGGEPGLTHCLTADLIQRGWLRYIVTTNFDSLFEMACRRQGRDLHVVSHEPGFVAWLHTRDSPALFKIHGTLDASGDSPRHVQAEVRQVARGLSPERRAVLEDLVQQYVFLFLGYSGRDFFGAMPVLFGADFHRFVWLEHTAGGAAQQNAIVARWLGSRSSGTYLLADTRRFLSALCERLHLPSEAETGGPRPWPDPFAGEEDLLRSSADALVGELLAKAGLVSEAHRCFVSAFNGLDAAAHPRLAARCALACSQLERRGFDGFSLDFTAAENAALAVRLASVTDDQRLRMEAQLAKYDADLSLAVAFGSDLMPLLHGTQDVIDHARSRGEALVVAKGCELLAEIARHLKPSAPDPSLIEMAVSFLMDTMHYQELEFAQDLLAGSYYRLGYLFWLLGRHDQELLCHVRRLKCLLLIRQSPEHEHVVTCITMIRRLIDRLGQEDRAVKHAQRMVALLGIDL